jgi:TP901 family phage tail tape measure protein
MAKTPKLVIPVEADIKKAAANLNKIKNTTKSTTGGMAKFADKAKKNFLALGAGIAASGFAIKKFLGVAGDFEQSIANVAAVSGGARKELEALARTTGATTVFSAKESADAMYFLASAGIAVTDMTFVLTPALNLASAAQIGVAEATDITINSLKIFGAEMEDAAMFTDIMATTVRKSNTDMLQLGEAIKVSGSTAKLAGVSFEDLNVLIAGMANQGIKGSEAGTKLRQSFARLLKPTAEAQKTLLKYNITQTDIANNIKDPIKLFKLLAPAMQNTADATEILGVRQLAVAGLIKDGIPDLVKLKTAMADAGGTAKKMAEEQLNTLNGSLKLLQSAFQEVILSGAGEGGLLDIFKNIVTALIKAVKAFQKVPGPVKAVTIGISLLIPAFIALQAVMGPVGLAFLAVGAAMAVLAPKMIDFRDTSSKVADITDKLLKIQTDYKTVIEQLNDPTKKLTKSEKALLELRKSSLILKEQKAIQELIKARKEYNDSLDKTKEKRKDSNKALERSDVRIIQAAKLQKILNNETLTAQQRVEELGKIINKGKGFFTKITGAANLFEVANLRINNAKRVRAKVNDEVISSEEKLVNSQIEDAKFVDVLSQSYINYRDSLDGAKLSQEDLTLLSEKDQLLIKKKVEALDAEAKAVKKVVIVEEIVVKKKIQLTKEEISALEELNNKKQFLLDNGIATEQELTRLTVTEVDKRISEWSRELNEKAQLIQKGNELFKAGFDVAGNIFDNYMQNRFDRTNEFNDQLKVMDEEERLRTQENLQLEIDALIASGTAEDLELAAEKQRELDRMKLEDQAAKRDKQIKRDEAIANRKMAVAKRIGAGFSIVADTAVAVAKAIAASPLTFGAPWSGFAIGAGALGLADLIAEPLPPIPALAKGGSFTTNGPMLALLGDNPSGRENVNVEPLNSSTVSTTTSDDHSKKEFHFHGITNLQDARNELMRTEGQGAFN